MGDISVRLATIDDLEAIHSIYNYYVLNSVTTYQEEPEPIETRVRWFARHGPRHPVTVAQMNGQIVGWASISPFHTRSAYRNTVENSVYVDHAHHRRGIGLAQCSRIDRAPLAAGHHTIIAGIDSEQAASLALHQDFGFVQVAHLKEVGFKFGRWLDVIYLQKMVIALADSAGTSGVNPPPFV